MSIRSALGGGRGRYHTSTKETSYGFTPYGFGCVGWKVGKKRATCTWNLWANMCVECALGLHQLLIGYYGPLIFSRHSTTHAFKIHNKG